MVGGCSHLEVGCMSRVKLQLHPAPNLHLTQIKSLGLDVCKINLSTPIICKQALREYMLFYMILVLSSMGKLNVVYMLEN